MNKDERQLDCQHEREDGRPAIDEDGYCELCGADIAISQEEWDEMRAEWAIDAAIEAKYESD